MGKRNFVINTILKKCPRCHEGDLFISPFEFSKPLNMPSNCNECGQKFEPEPGYYYGAMFLSYIFSAFLYLSIMGVSIIVLGMSLNVAFALLLVIAVLTYYFFLRYSRSFWINIMVNFDPEAKKNYSIKSFGD